MIRPKNQTEDLLLTKTKNCETFIKQTHRKPQDTLEFKMIKPRKTFHFNPPIQIKEVWMLGLTDLEVYHSVFNKNTTNNKFNLYKFPDKKLVEFHTKKSEMRLKKTSIIRILQIPSYTMKY